MNKEIQFYIVATPIGNYDDISLRAIKVLNEVDFIVCEEEKEYKKFFSICNIPEKKFIVCNEHLEKEAIELVIPLLKKGESGALISDCGTPLFEDPGKNLLKAIRLNNFKITSLPGANSLITAMSLCPFEINDFYYAGFLPKKKDERNRGLKNLLKRKETIILFETPYRLNKIVNSLVDNVRAGRNIFIAYNLTMSDEEILYGKPLEVKNLITKKNIVKGEFLVIIERQKLKK